MTPHPPTVLRYVRAAVGPDADGPTDAALLARFAATRDEGAFELLVWRHAGMVLRVCRRAVRDHQSAEDATQAVFLALARQAGAVGRRGTVAGWLYRVARRVSVRAAGRLQKGASALSADLDQIPVPSPDPPPDPDLLRYLHDEVDRLPEKYRAAVVLCFFEGLTQADAARRLGLPVGTLSTRVARAKDLLHRRLAGRGVVVPVVGLATGPAVAITPAFATATARAATGYAIGKAVPGVSQTVLELAKGATWTMTATKLQWAAGLLVACGLAAGGAWAGGQFPGGSAGGPPPAPSAAAPKAGGAGPVDRRATAAEEQRSLKNLRQIMLAIHSYDQEHEVLPADVRDKNGKVLLSWRVLLLPYLGQRTLYDQFKLDQPWDSEHNLRLLAKMPDVYRVGVEPEGATHTYYQGFAGPGTLFDPAGDPGYDSGPGGAMGPGGYGPIPGGAPGMGPGGRSGPIGPGGSPGGPGMSGPGGAMGPGGYGSMPGGPGSGTSGPRPGPGGPPIPGGPGGPGMSGPGAGTGPPPGPGAGGRGPGGAPGGAPGIMGSSGGPAVEVTGPGQLVRPAKWRGMRITMVADGTSNTLGVVEAGPPVAWTRPADIVYDPKKPLPELIGPFANALHVVMADGVPAAFRRNIDPKHFRHLIEINDGNPIPDMKTLLARRPAETPEEWEALRKQIRDNEDRIAEVQKLLKEYTDLAGRTNRATTDLMQPEEQAEKLRAVITILKVMNRKLRADLAPRPGEGGARPTENRK